jgi:ABC-type transport system involved in cytochrome c biogenesis, permease component
MQVLGTAGKVVLGLGMAVVLWAAFLYAHPAESFVGESSRIVFFHVPTAWISALAFLLAAIHSGLYLKTRKMERDDAAAAAARLGILFCVLATVTGSLFAKVMWNSYWNWDPRQTSIVLLLLVYGAYLGLRQAIEEPERRATLSAAYALIAFVSVPFLMFAVPACTPRSTPTPSSTRGAGSRCPPDIKLVFFSSMIAFTALFAWLYALDVKATRLVRRLSERAGGTEA